MRALALLATLICAALLVACGEAKAPKKQVTTIKLVPDTPPPPPPPREPPKEQPKEQPKEVHLDQPKPAEAPPQPAEQIKMEGAATDGPGGIAAGSVTSEKIPQVLGTGPGGGMEFRLYQMKLQKLIQDELNRVRELRGVEYRVPALVRQGADGAITEIALGQTGDADIDAILEREVRKVLKREPPPMAAPKGGFTIYVSNKMIN